MKAILFNRLRAFGHAFNGLSAAFKREQAIKVHAFASLIVIAICVFTNISLKHSLLLTLACIAVLAVELINTAIEKTCDLVSTKKNAQIKFIKDVSAAAVLLMVVAALAVGSYVLLSEF